MYSQGLMRPARRENSVWETGAINKRREKNLLGGYNSTEIQVCSSTVPDSSGNPSLGSAKQRDSCRNPSCASAGHRHTRNTRNSCQGTPIHWCPCQTEPSPGAWRLQLCPFRSSIPAPATGICSTFGQNPENETSDEAGRKEPMEYLSFHCVLKSGT